METPFTAQLEKWHQFVKSEGSNTEVLAAIIADDCIFRSPVVWTPQLGKAITLRYLTAASHVLKDFKYTRELAGGNSIGLQFEARVGEVTVIGIDLIAFNEAGLIKDFEVMVRPAKAAAALAEAMKEELTRV